MLYFLPSNDVNFLFSSHNDPQQRASYYTWRYIIYMVNIHTPRKGKKQKLLSFKESQFQLDIMFPLKREITWVPRTTHQRKNQGKATINGSSTLEFKILNVDFFIWSCLTLEQWFSKNSPSINSTDTWELVRTVLGSWAVGSPQAIS